jgi:hypothetical protein
MTTDLVILLLSCILCVLMIISWDIGKIREALEKRAHPSPTEPAPRSTKVKVEDSISNDCNK